MAAIEALFVKARKGVSEDGRWQNTDPQPVASSDTASYATLYQDTYARYANKKRLGTLPGSNSLNISSTATTFSLVGTLRYTMNRLVQTSGTSEEGPIYAEAQAQGKQIAEVEWEKEWPDLIDSQVALDWTPHTLTTSNAPSGATARGYLVVDGAGAPSWGPWRDGDRWKFAVGGDVNARGDHIGTFSHGGGGTSSWQSYDWSSALALEEAQSPVDGDGLPTGIASIYLASLPGILFGDDGWKPTSTADADTIVRIHGIGMSVRMTCRPVRYRVNYYRDLEDFPITGVLGWSVNML